MESGAGGRRAAAEAGHGDGAVPETFAWRGHEEGVTYVAAMVSFVALGVVLRTAVLNWVAGPLYFVCFVWTSAAVLERLRRGRSRS